MDYKRVYEFMIEDRRAKESSLSIFDRHHILPKALGGGNGPENIIKLSPSDHFFCHLLLAKIHGGVMAICAARMSGMKKYTGNGARRNYSHLKTEQRKKLSELAKTQWSNPDSSEKLKQAVRRSRTPELSEKLRVASLGKKASPEARKAMSDAAFARAKREKEQGITRGPGPEGIAKLSRLMKERKRRTKQ